MSHLRQNIKLEERYNYLTRDGCRTSDLGAEKRSPSKVCCCLYKAAAEEEEEKESGFGGKPP